jgi:uncharacterized protein (TIGR02266 family)
MRERAVPISVLMRYFRVPVGELPVDYPGRELLLGSRITNISISGVFIRTNKPLPEKSELAIGFRLPGGRTDIKTQAVVRWRSSGRGAGMGLEFLSISKKDQKLIETYVRAFLKRMRQG